MSFRGRRCIINKLDFENCIVTSGKTSARGRKKLRARITRQVEDLPPAEESQTSPVLMRTQRGGGESPALAKRRKINFSLGEEDAPDTSTIEEPRSPSSPVFKVLKKSKIASESPDGRGRWVESPVRKMAAVTDSEEDSCRIDDASTQESKDSVRISSVESTDLKKNSRSTSSGESAAVRVCRDSPGQWTAGCSGVVKSDSKRSHRQLRKLQQKQASEKLLWQHQNRRNSASALRFAVIAFWRDEFNFFLKCSPLPAGLAVTFLIVDSRWVPDLRHVKKSSVLQLHPPWQKLTLEESNTNVFVNVICLDVLDEMEEEPMEEKRLFETVPADPFETCEKPFIDSLFSSTSCGFLS